MRSCATKLVALFLLLVLASYLATSSTLLPQCDKKSSPSNVFDCKVVLRGIIAGEEGKPVPSRSLRSLLMPPPPPIKNRQTAMRSRAPPPLVA